MSDDREMRAAHDRNDTQLMLARDAGDERSGSAIGSIKRVDITHVRLASEACREADPLDRQLRASSGLMH
jgi:hypothetical protein